MIAIILADCALQGFIIGGILNVWLSARVGFGKVSYVLPLGIFCSLTASTLVPGPSPWCVSSELVYHFASHRY